MSVESLPPVPLPNVGWGFVVGRVIHAIADTIVDVDRYPDGRAAQGSVTFTPKVKLTRVTTAGQTAFVLNETVQAQLSDTGELVDINGLPGIWLVEGTWTVAFNVPRGTALPALTITVTPSHTIATPLDLVTASPEVILPGATVTTMLVPSGAAEGQVLSWTNGSLKWVAQTGGTGGTGSAVTWGNISGRPVVVAEGATVDAARESIGAAKAMAGAVGSFAGIWTAGSAPVPTGTGPFWGIEI